MRWIYVCTICLCAFQFAPASIDLEVLPQHPVAVSYVTSTLIQFTNLCEYITLESDSEYLYIRVLEFTPEQRVSCQIAVSDSHITYHIPIHLEVNHTPKYAYEFDASLVWDGFSYYLLATIQNRGTVFAPIHMHILNETYSVSVYPNLEKKLVHVLTQKPLIEETVSFCVIDCEFMQTNKTVFVQEQLQKPYVEILKTHQEDFFTVDIFTNQTPLRTQLRMQTETELFLYDQLFTESRTQLSFSHNVESLQVLWNNQILLEWEKQRTIQTFSFPKVSFEYVLIILVILCGVGALYWKRKQST